MIDFGYPPKKSEILQKFKFKNRVYSHALAKSNGCLSNLMVILKMCLLLVCQSWIASCYNAKPQLFGGINYSFYTNTNIEVIKVKIHSLLFPWRPLQKRPSSQAQEDKGNPPWCLQHKNKQKSMWNKLYTTGAKYIYIYLHKKQHKPKSYIIANEHSAVMCPRSSISAFSHLTPLTTSHIYENPAGWSYRWTWWGYRRCRYTCEEKGTNESASDKPASPVCVSVFRPDEDLVTPFFPSFHLLSCSWSKTVWDVHTLPLCLYFPRSR